MRQGRQSRRGRGGAFRGAEPTLCTSAQQKTNMLEEAGVILQNLAHSKDNVVAKPSEH
jgi:hypothetical protein